MKTLILSILTLALCAAAPADKPANAPKPEAKPEIKPQKKAEPEKKPEPKAKLEEAYYRLVTLPLPNDLVMEIGGLEWLDKEKKRLLACTRRGEMFIVDNPYMDPPKLAEDGVRYKQFIFGLHEPLGIAVRNEEIFVAQRGEVTRLRDTNRDDRVDLVETFCDQWQISGSYHEYAFGPTFDRQGRMWITLNRPFGGEVEGKAKWRGWAVTIDSAGKMTPQCVGLRSPAGVGANAEGDVFFTDNQGDWVPVCKLSHLVPGAFYGNEIGLASTALPDSPIKPIQLPKQDVTLAEAVRDYPVKLPAVWFPYPRMGKSHGEVIVDSTGGKFGPFANQLFVGDQSQSIIIRVFLEKVDGEYQGVCFPFRDGFQCGCLRMVFGHDGSMFVGQTGRGWGAAGGKPFGLQRLVWTGKTPFEVHEMRAKPDGFELTFTQEVDPATAGDVKSYSSRCWTYYWHKGYGCPPIDTQPLTIKSATVGADRKSVRLVYENLKPTFIHELKLEGVRNKEGQPILHPEAYYTLNKIPQR